MNGSALVTGGAGFVGANVVRRLVDDGLEVHALTRRETNRWRLDGLEQIRTHVCPLEDSDRVNELVATIRPEWVFHLAAHGAYASQTDYRRIVEVNTLGTLNLLDAVAKTGACAGFVHTGSSSEYGLKDHAPAEDEIVHPDSVYAVTKCAATHAVSHWARTTGLAASTVRLYSVYGRWEEPTRLMPRLVVCALAGTLPVLTSPSTARDFVWIDDAVDGIVRAAREATRRPGAIWNLGSGEQTTLEELVGIVRGVFGVEEEPSWGTMPDRSWDTASWRSDPRRARDQLGWAAVTGLDQGLRATAQWLGETPERDRYVTCP